MWTAIGILAVVGLAIMVILIVHRSKERNKGPFIDPKGDEVEPCHSYELSGNGIVTYDDCYGTRQTINLESNVKHIQARRVVYSSPNTVVLKIV